MTPASQLYKAGEKEVRAIVNFHQTDRQTGSANLPTFHLGVSSIPSYRHSCFDKIKYFIEGITKGSNPAVE